ncbi:MAG: ATP-binding protein [Chloroflexi bacterium]|nr:MAG: ATP-binding protein [Chloroflexota bacterium]
MIDASLRKVSICGKGGSGKSIVAVLLARALLKKGYTVLAVDADESNPGLHRMFGFESAPRPLVDIAYSQAYLAAEFAQEEIQVSDIPGEYVAEEGNLKLMIIGKIDRALQGCACVMGAVVKDFLAKLVLRDGEVCIVDTEAGIEHFGRGLEKHIDTVLLVIEPSFESFALADKAAMLARGVETPLRIWAILNKVSSPDVESNLREKLLRRAIRVAGVIHYDAKLYHDCWVGSSLGHCHAQEEVEAIAEVLLSS